MLPWMQLPPSQCPLAAGPMVLFCSSSRVPLLLKQDVSPEKAAHSLSSRGLWKVLWWRRRRRRRRRWRPRKSPDVGVSPAAQVSATFRRSASTLGGLRGSSRSPTPVPSEDSGFSCTSNRLSSSGDLSHPLPGLSKQSVTSNNPNRPGLRRFPKVSSARSRPLKRLSPILIFGSFRRFHWVTPPLPGNFVPFRHCFGKVSRAGVKFGFFRHCFGSFRLRERMRGGSESYRRGAGSQLLAPGSFGEHGGKPDFSEDRGRCTG